MKAIICVGVSGSGKSTWAELVFNFRNLLGPKPCVVINRDETRWKLSGKRGWNGPNAYKFDRAIEKAVTHHNLNLIEMCAIEKKDIIIADTNLNPKTRDTLWEQCEAFGYEVSIKEFTISFQEACTRDKQRGIYAVGEDVLMKQWTMWCKYYDEKCEGMWESQSEE